MSHFSAHSPTFCVRLVLISPVCYSHAGDEREPNLIPLASMVVLPKHAVLPEIPVDGNLHFEVILYLLGLVVMGLQYVNLYKTVWWLPHSHANYALVSHVWMISWWH